METEHRILSIIPARAGSKGLPNKNISICGGKPLIQWTIEASLKSKYITDTLVSTDSEEIKRVSKENGAWVPFLRKESLSHDESDIVDVVKNAITEASKIKGQYDFVILLQPTAPLRTTEDIDNAFDQFFNNKKTVSDTLISVYEVDRKYLWVLGINDSSDYLYTHFDIDLTKPRRQELENCYLPNGAIYIAPVEKFDGFYKKNAIPYLMDPNKSVDIDHIEDLIKADQLLKSFY